MKKFFFAAIAVCGFVVVNAQNSASSSTPTGNPGPVNANAEVVVMLYNAIELVPRWEFYYNTEFKTVADYNGPAKDMGERNWSIKSTKPGKIQITLTDLVDDDGGQTIDKSKMTYVLNSQAPAAGNVAIPQVPFVAGETTDVVVLGLSVHPGWAHQGGKYKGLVTVTATQD